MATFDYNPITGNLDLVGSGASYIDGVVADSSLLPVTLGTPPLDAVYLAKAGSGVWLINRKPAGLYCRVANNGNAADWTYLGAFPEVNADGNWELYNTADPTKELKFDLSNITTGTTRTLTVPNNSGTITLNSDLAAIATSGSASDLTSGTVATARLGTGTANSTSFLRGDGVWATTPETLVIACSDETTNLTTGTAKVTFRMPYAMTLTAVRSSVNTAPTGSTLIVDINEGANSILSTKLSIDASEKTSTTAASAAVISDSALADDAEMTIDIDQIGSTVAGKGLKVVLIGTRA